MFVCNNIQSSNFFTQNFQNDQIQILPIHLDHQLTYKFNLLIWKNKYLNYFNSRIIASDLNKETEPVKNYRLQLIGVVSGGCLLLIILSAIMKIDTQQLVEMKVGDAGLIKSLGKNLFSNYVLPFEISSVLFLSAMIGAVVIGKKD